MGVHDYTDQLMAIAFLDMLGVLYLKRYYPDVVDEFFKRFQTKVDTKFSDTKCNPLYLQEGENEESLNLMRKNSVSSFEEKIIDKHSLIVAGKDIDMFIEQLASLVAYIYITSSTNDERDYYKLSEDVLPMLLRGGISCGTDVEFFGEYCTQNGLSEFRVQSVKGSTYQSAVKYENSGKGPRLFCDRSVVDATQSSRRLFKIFDGGKGIYEIVWTVNACESFWSRGEDGTGSKWKNVEEGINEKMLSVAVDFYQQCLRQKVGMDSNIMVHCIELIKLACEGVVRYAYVNFGSRSDDAIDLINGYLKNMGIENEELFLEKPYCWDSWLVK